MRAMRQLIRVLTIAAVVLLTMMLGETCRDVSLLGISASEYKAQESSQLPIADDYGMVFTAPVQVPTLLPNQTLRLVAPAKCRTSLMRTNLLRRCTNRLSTNIYTPLASTGQLVVERLTAPLRNTNAVHFYVFELCRLLC